MRYECFVCKSKSIRNVGEACYACTRKLWQLSQAKELVIYMEKRKQRIGKEENETVVI